MEPSLRRAVSWRDPVALARLRRRIQALDCELVVTHQSKAGVLGRLAARAAGAPPVVHSLSMADFGPGYGTVESRLFRALERNLARWTTGYAVVGTDLATRFGQIGVPVEKLTVIRSAVRLPRYGVDRDEVRRAVARDARAARGSTLDPVRREPGRSARAPSSSRSCCSRRCS